ncbi:MAG TPA: SDR family NAD(P)-dependent oxidoreductase [Dehalococcoidia bacterium]|nr:SDR family NAD(P)-dependent oxidoreductase [Dehalococcoidia bacterium]
MRDLDGKVAVVTGGASGIGFAMAERFAREGMKVVLADIEQAALDAAVSTLRQQERDVIGVRTDVSQPDAVDALAQATLGAYGKVNLVCNNAGVFLRPGPMWESTLRDWNWILGVNLWGVINGVRSFLPIMLKQDEDGHVINTASQAGLVTSNSIYSITKHAVVALSEALLLQLKQQNARIGVSCLCPLFVDTRIMEAERNRPAELFNEGRPEGPNPLRMANATPPSEQADEVLEALLEGRFYIFPRMDVVDDNVRYRFDNIINRRDPEPRPMR